MPRRPYLVLLAAALAAFGCADDEPEPDVLRGRVVRVVDGDTLKVRVAGRRETVRLVGIDTPESVAPGRPVECGGRAAARNLRRLVLTPDGRGRTVVLTTDPSQDREDRYGRLLAYVELAGGDRDVGAEQVRAGWAEVFVYRGRPFARASAYRRAESAAREAARGAWSRCG